MAVCYHRVLALCMATFVVFMTSSSFAFSPISSVQSAKSSRHIPLQRQTIQFPDSERTSCGIIIFTTRLDMARDDEGPGLLTRIGILAIMVLFLVTGLLPLLQGNERDLSIADSVVTQQDVPGKLKSFESKQDRLSRATIQEKLSGIPVFYLVDESGTMSTSIYVSYADAKAASDGSPGSSLKATSLDQVMYPLVLKRGRMRMAPPPPEIQKAEAELSSNTENSGRPAVTYRLVPSKSAVEEAKEFNLNLAENDIPLFVADRLAFAGAKGPQLPLFTDKSDCMLSYQRLRGSKSTLPEQPTIRTATLLGELSSMEKGTRPGVSQLAFYATVDDVEKAAEMLQ